jgi:hypothetical protein
MASDYPHPKDEYLLSSKPIGLRVLARKWAKLDKRWSINKIVNASRREDWPTQRRRKQDEIRDRAISKAVTQISDDAAKRIRRLIDLAQAVQVAGVTRLREYLRRNVDGKMSEREAISAIVEGARLEILVAGGGKEGGGQIEGSQTLEGILDRVERERAAAAAAQVNVTVNVHGAPGGVRPEKVIDLVSLPSGPLPPGDVAHVDSGA